MLNYHIDRLLEPIYQSGSDNGLVSEDGMQKFIEKETICFRLYSLLYGLSRKAFLHFIASLIKEYVFRSVFLLTMSFQMVFY